MIILDTHVLLWLDREDPALVPSSRERILTAWGQGSVAVCAISFWEVAMFAARGRCYAMPLVSDRLCLP